MKTWKTQIAGAVLIAVMAIALGVEAGHLPRKTSSTVPLASTTFPITHHVCAQTDAAIGNTGIIQAADGTLAACLRVGSVAAGTYRIAARRNKPGGTILGSTGPSGDWLTLTPPSGPPGTHIKVSGYVANLTVGQRGFDRAQLCWESCDALVGSVQIDWSADKPGQFTADLVAPAAPWFSGTTVAPLRPGRYRVTFPCLPSFDKPGGSCSGVRLEAHFDLTGQGSSRCISSLPCAVLQSTPAAGPPGTVVAVDGWAPLTALTGDGFVAVAFEGEAAGKPGYDSFTPLVSSTPFTITGAPGWASLPPLRPVFSQRTGMDAIGVDPANPRRFAYCGNGVIKMTITGGSSWSSIPLAGVRAVSASTNYPIPGSFSGTTPVCSSVVLDPRFPATVYAVFAAATRSGPPPLYFVAYVTRNSGRTWQLVPVPAKSEMGQFGGFRVHPSGVQALFWPQATTDSTQPPAFLVEQTTDGGRTWPAASLRCPVSGPCIGLGPQDNGRCMAVGEWQAIEISTDGGRSWTSPGWPGRLSACSTSELVGLDSNGIAAVDQMGPYPIMRSSDGGSSWEDVALPLLPGADADPGNVQGSLQILPDGRLLLAGYRWYLLGSGAAAWCSVAAAPPISNGEWSASPRLIGDRLYWSDPTVGAAVGVTLRSFPISAVHC